MKIFISWSGELSKAIGEILRGWLPCLIQSVEPYFTPSDIEKGSRWLPGISRELDESTVGIFCVTQYNLKSEWMLFEAGAISKSIRKSRVCPVLFDVSPGELPSPMQQFQATLFTKEDVRQLVVTINSAAANGRLTDNLLNTAFEKWWPDLQEEISKAINEYKPETPQKKKTDYELLNEILQVVRYNSNQQANLPVVRLSREPKRVSTFKCLPSASANRGEIYFVVDLPPDGKYGVCFSNGVSWRSLKDVEIID